MVLKFPDYTALMPHQIEVLNSPQRFKVIVWHRRARKTTTATVEIVKQALHRVGAYWHVLPTFANAKDIVWRDPNMLFRIIPPQLIKKRNEQELVVYLTNGSYIQLKGADDPEALRGPNPLGIVFDEFATMKFDAWRIMEPVIRANSGWVWFIGTPRGKNHLHKLFVQGQQSSKEWKSWILKASTSGIVEADQLAESKASMSDDLFNQEWECAWLDGTGSVFRGVQDVMFDPEGKALLQPQQPEGDCLYVIGADLAKLHDFTVLTVYNARTNEQVYQDRFQTLEWPFQKAKIKALSEHYNRARVILDATGLGDPIADDLIRAGVPVEPFKLTETTKKELIEKLSIWIEQRKIKMLPLKETLKEFEDFTYKLGDTGKVHYGAPSGEGFFDDIVISQALAVWALQTLYKPVIERPLSIIQAYKQRKDSQYEQEENWRDFDAI